MFQRDSLNKWIGLTTSDGYSITGIAGEGAYKIVFRAERADSNETGIVIKMLRGHLCFTLDLPPDRFYVNVGDRFPNYHRLLGERLEALIGSQILNFTYPLVQVWEHAALAIVWLIANQEHPSSIEYLRSILDSPVVWRMIDGWRSLGEKAKDFSPIDGIARSHYVYRLSGSVSDLRKLSEVAVGFQGTILACLEVENEPNHSTLEQNPMLPYLAAVTCGFSLTGAEIRNSKTMHSMEIDKSLDQILLAFSIITCHWPDSDRTVAGDGLAKLIHSTSKLNVSQRRKVTTVIENRIVPGPSTITIENIKK